MSHSLSWNPPKIQDLEAVYDWQADHAARTHNGSFGEEIRTFPRPWVYRTLSMVAVDEMIQAYLDKDGDIKKAFDKTVEDLKKAFTETIESPIFYYPTKTYRQNGEVVTSPRDIVDRGTLRDSLRVS